MTNNTDFPKKSPFAEIIESSLTNAHAQSWQWDAAPCWGELVVVSDNQKNVFCLVHDITTGSHDAIRRPQPFRKTHEQLLHDHPQIFEFLKTTFCMVPLGYQDLAEHPGSHSKSILYLPPQEPLRIHAFVETCPPALAQQFFQSDHYWTTLFSLGAQLPNFNELIIATIKYQIALKLMSRDKLSRILQRLSLLMGQDYRSFKVLVQRIERLIEHMKHAPA